MKTTVHIPNFTYQGNLANSEITGVFCTVVTACKKNVNE